MINYNYRLRLQKAINFLRGEIILMKPNRLLLAIFLTALLLLCQAWLSGCGAGGGGGTGGGGADPSTVGAAQGNVCDGRAGVAGVAVSVLGTALSTTTNGAGFYQINNIPTGLKTLRFAKDGYTSQDQPVNVTSGQTSTCSPSLITARPQVDAVSPASGSFGSTVTITGLGFGVTQGTVTFNGVNAASLSSWCNTRIIASAPNSSTGRVKTQAGGVWSQEAVNFTYSAPVISSLNPASGPVESLVTLTGSNFGTAQGTNRVTFNGTDAGNAVSWSDTQVVAAVPEGATSGNVTSTTGAGTSNGVNFTVTVEPLTYSFNKRVTGINGPQGMSFDRIALNIYLTNPPNITVFDQNLDRLPDITIPIESHVASAVTTDGQYVYFVNSTFGELWRISTDGTAGIKLANCGWGRDLSAEYGDYIVVLETSNRVDGWVQVFNNSGTSVYGPWQIAGANSPESIALSPDGTIRVADTQNDRILHYSLTGTLLDSFGSTGTGEGQFNSPSAISVASNGYMYIIDRSNYRFEVFNSNGQFLGQYQGTHGDGDGQFNYACGITPDNSGNVYYSNFDGLNIQKFVLNP